MWEWYNIWDRTGRLSDQGRIQDFGKGGGGGGLINIFTTGGRGRAPPVTARGSGGAVIAPPVGSGAKPQPLSYFCVYEA